MYRNHSTGGVFGVELALIRMKIGYLVQNLNRKTGGGRFAADIIDGVRAEGHEVVVLKEDDDGLEGYPILKRGPSLLMGAYHSLSYLKDCDVIHAIDGYPYGLTAWLVNKIIKAKLIISALGTYAVAPLYRWQTVSLMKWAYRSAYKVIPISRFTEKEILKKVDLKNTVVINPGIDIHQEGKRIKSDKRFILGVGGIKERKGYHIALQAFALLAQGFEDLHYVLVGDEDLSFQTVLDSIIRKNNLEGRVEFLHRIPEEELQRLYQSAELFILTPITTVEQHFEGYGLVFLEAARAGLPVIGTRGSGTEDAIKDGYNGILVEQFDIDGTAKAMRSILIDPSLQESMSKASLDWAGQNSIENEVKKILEIYKE